MKEDNDLYEEDEEDDIIQFASDEDDEIKPFESMEDMFDRIHHVKRSKYGININVNEISETGEKLNICYSDEGFCLRLICKDNISKAVSKYFTWEQLIQMLIAADPDMFGALDEPTHNIFPFTLMRFGYRVPGWKGLEKNQYAILQNYISISNDNKHEIYDYQNFDPIVAYFKLGMHFSKQQDWEHAINAFTSIIELDPEDAYAYDRRGIAYGEIGKYEESLNDFNTAISINDTFAGAYNNRGLSYYKTYRFDDAIENYNKAIELSPEIATFYDNRGLAYHWKEDYESAIKDFNKTIELSPDMNETHNHRGEVYAILNDYKKALADFDYELKINPDNIVAYGNRQAILEELNQRKESENE